jgi:hypothetical protein
MEAILAAPFGDQPVEVEHRPAFDVGQCAANQLVVVLVERAEGRLGHARFLGVRSDKSAREIRRDE